jgi:hypothetical protein
MALKNGKPNPLNYFDLRRVDFAAPHFKYVVLEKYTPNYIKIIDNWINKNLNNRYYLGQFLMLDSNNSIVYATRVGFESEKELSFFNLACPVLQQR